MTIPNISLYQRIQRHGNSNAHLYMYIQTVHSHPRLLRTFYRSMPGSKSDDAREIN